MEEIYQLIHRKQTAKKNITTMALARSMISSVSANLSVLYQTRGHCSTVGAACASGAMAVAQGTQAIRSGEQDCVIAGGVQEGTWEYDILFEALRAFSKREDRPTEASRPFDKNRDGLVPSGGCGFVVLEEYERAEHRGATIYAEIVGLATNSDGNDMTAPSGEGSVRCMKLALADARLTEDQIDYVNAHATATQIGDIAEARSIAKVFGDRPHVSATKSMTGHEIGAAGCTELIYTLLMINHGFVAPTINLDDVDEECQGMRVVANQAVEMDIDIAMSNSFGFGGVNTVLIVKRPTI